MTKDLSKKKKKGPLRFEAIIPMLIIVVLIWAYFFFLFDTHLKWGLQTAATNLNGAEVDIADVETNFLKGSFHINGVQVTNAEEPSKNTVEVGQLRFQFLWDALLRMKFVVNEAAVEKIQVATTRKSPGYIVPQKSEDLQAPSGSSNKALDQAAEMLTKNIDMSELNSIKLENSKALAKIEELKAELPLKQKLWKETVDGMPSAKDFQSLQSRVQQLKVGGTSNPAELQAQVQQAQALINEANDKSNQLKSKVNFLNTDINNFSGSVSSVDSLVQEDIRTVESKLKLPALDTEGLARSLFGEELFAKFIKYKRYALMAKKYMPPKKEKDEDILVPRSRAEGVNIEFPITTGYPLFWLQKAVFSSKADGSPFGGDVSGEIRDVTSNPALIGRPVVATFKGDFEKTQVRNINAKIILDHRQAPATQSLTASVGSFPVEGKMFSKSESAQFGFSEALGHGQVEAFAKGDQVSIQFINFFDHIDYLVDSNNEQMKGILVNVTKDIPKVTLNAKATGSWTQLQWDIDTNLARELSQGFSKQITGKLNEARQKIREAVESKIGKQKSELNQQFQSAQAPVQKQVKEKEQEVQKLQASAQSKLKEVQNQATSQGTKSLDDIKKKFGF